ncbi:MAG: c-type cytochrome [Allosphingosinicella sp.]
MDDRANTIAGWVLGAGIVALGATIVTGEMFHEERPEKMGYPIEGVELPTDTAAAAEKPAAFYLAAGNAQAGEQVFKKCTACHNADKGGANGTGPNLWGVVGGPIGHHAPGFAYSPALAGKGGNWSFENLFQWVKSPKDFAPGTKMTFAGLSKPEDRANVIAFLNSHSDSPQPLPAAPAATAAPGAAAPATPNQAPANEQAARQPVPTEAQATPAKNVGGEGAPSVSGNAQQTKK